MVVLYKYAFSQNFDDHPLLPVAVLIDGNIVPTTPYYHYLILRDPTDNTRKDNAVRSIS